MDAVKYLKDYILKAEPLFTDFFRKERAIARNIDPLAVEVVDNLERFLQGGKKVRGALTVLGYQSVGGKKINNILPVSMAVELMHSSLLIHDDFIDNDLYRRGKPTIHSLYSRKYSPHYGASIALIVGDLGIFLSHKILAGSKFDPVLIRKAILTYEKLLVNTGQGEIMDIAFDFKKNATWDDVRKVRIYKTSHYTFAMPLSLGAILGGANDAVLDAIMKYSEPVGIAFQIIDDLLGIFGDTKLTGKSNNSDIKEGKITLVYLKAFENANNFQRNFMKKWYGNKNISADKIDEIKNIIEETGSFQKCRNIACELVVEGKRYTKGITTDKKILEVLNSLADFTVERNS